MLVYFINVLSEDRNKTNSLSSHFRTIKHLLICLTVNQSIWTTLYSIVNFQCWFQTLYSVFFTNERNGTKTFRLKSRKESLFQELPIQLKKNIVLCKSGYLDNIPRDS